ncbi:MAG: asparagine synthase (glutamine-hydrolyzing) [Verrucomicrobia bacterium]|nr:asparagine synthase (glutamine-hydrolyzing) [Verrucomicrobiota bacterium]MBV8486599.1 asparagine synthase (glutamine-hydrolyzing) [Verrucomicrobiota bacterium]
MCGIAGIIDLAGGRTLGDDVIHRMTQAIIHRGPDEEGYFQRPGLALGSRRLSIVGLADGQQPVTNEDRTVFVVFNGEFFDFPERRAELKSRGHRLVTHCDTEIIPHYWEDDQERMFEHLRGQFAFALWDDRRRCLVLGRDRFGIAPLYWTKQGDWLLFASEIKALLASGMVPAEPDLRGIDHIFTFSALPGPTTCFRGVKLLQAGHYLMIRPGDQSGTAPKVKERAYWKMDFPDRGEEDRGENAKALVDRFENLLLNAVEERLRADVPVGSYLSGGVDSSVIAALACHVKGPAINTYTVRVDAPDMDELDAANLVARHIGTKPPIVQNFRTEDVLNTYPHLIHSAEAPVIDTSCAALLQLAGRVHSSNQKVVLTGEGADEWLIGYPWYKAAKILNFLDVIPGIPLSDVFRRGYLGWHHVPQYSASFRREVEDSLGGPNAWIDAYGLLGISKLRFYAPPLREVLRKHNAWADLKIPLDRAKRWHPLNRGVWVAARVTLAGHLLQAKGDRVAMNSSVEVRYPFLDEEVFSFLASLDPRWKLRGFRDKHLLRLLAKRWVPPSVYRRQKQIFRAPLDSFHIEPEPPFVGQLMSEESLRRTGYFDVEQVRHWRHAFRQLRPDSLERLSVEMGLVAVVATQLWHHLFIKPDLAEIPSLTASGELAQKASLRSG